MCGIAGFYGNFEQILLERMNCAQNHRGPDDAGTWYDTDYGVGFAHRRLSIIDLSPSGHQPMWDLNRLAIICFNGEIYNYRELRSELENLGYRFNGTSDTEVILNLYLHHGEAFLHQLNGIFAIALWDVRQKRLLIARDGHGVKPVYYATTSKGFVFASEIKALLQIPELRRDLDPEAILHYVTYLYAPYPRTPLASVHKLHPGYGAWVTPNGIERLWQFYRQPYGEISHEISVQEAEEGVRHYVDQAVRRQIVADVPVGAFLSGGLDSSAIVHFARRYIQGSELKCFTIDATAGSPTNDGITDDLPYARHVAKRLGVRLHTVNVTAACTSRLEEMIYHLDEPQADPAALNTLMICELARENGMKVLLSGAGGDDIFSGYRRHLALVQERYWSWLPQPARQMLKRLTQHLPPIQPWARRISKAFRYADEPPTRRLASYFFWLNPEWLPKLAGEQLQQTAASMDPLEPMLTLLGGLPTSTHPLHQMLALDSAYFLTDHNLNYTDKMSMASGVEVRVPLLDRDLVAFAAKLPPDFKQRGTTGKWIFKRAMEPLLSPEIVYRPKAGFGAPLRHWLKHELHEFVRDTLSPSALSKRGLFNAEAVHRLIHLDEKGVIDAAYPIFALVCIETWCRIFLDSR